MSGSGAQTGMEVIIMKHIPVMTLRGIQRAQTESYGEVVGAVKTRAYVQLIVMTLIRPAKNSAI